MVFKIFFYSIPNYHFRRLCDHRTRQYAAPAYKPAYSAPAYATPKAYTLEHAYAPIEYSFEYSVNNPYTYNVKNRQEYSDGNGYVKGSYSLLEVDGSTHVVE
jgi:hypothetical protein